MLPGPLVESIGQMWNLLLESLKLLLYAVDLNLDIVYTSLLKQKVKLQRL